MSVLAIVGSFVAGAWVGILVMSLMAVSSGSDRRACESTE
jgi:hypothetical protein